MFLLEFFRAQKTFRSFLSASPLTSTLKLLCGIKSHTLQVLLIELDDIACLLVLLSSNT